MKLNELALYFLNNILVFSEDLDEENDKEAEAIISLLKDHGFTLKYNDLRNAYRDTLINLYDDLKKLFDSADFIKLANKMENKELVAWDYFYAEAEIESKEDRYIFDEGYIKVPNIKASKKPNSINALILYMAANDCILDYDDYCRLLKSKEDNVMDVYYLLHSIFTDYDPNNQ